jgi:hypothetical protein
MWISESIMPATIVHIPSMLKEIVTILLKKYSL